MPPLAALLVSLLIHASAGGTILVFTVPAEPPVSEPEPVIIMAELVADPVTENEQPREVQKGEPEAMETMDDIPVSEDTGEASGAPEMEVSDQPDALPDAVPVPLMRPKPERKQGGEKRPDRTKMAKGLEKEPEPDVMTGNEQVLANESDASRIHASSRNVTTNLPAEQKWLGRLSAHLERRKRYPHSAQSRRQEGQVVVRFVVSSDGTIIAPEMVTSSGVEALDTEALDLLRRASPAPKPPPDVNTFITVPINFAMQR